MNKTKLFEENIKSKVKEITRLCQENKISFHLQFILDPQDGSSIPNISLSSFSANPEDDESILRLQDVSMRGWIPVSLEDIMAFYAAATNQNEVNEIVDADKLN